MNMRWYLPEIASDNNTKNENLLNNKVVYTGAGTKLRRNKNKGNKRDTVTYTNQCK
jgi:hypothetical protein